MSTSGGCQLYGALTLRSKIQYFFNAILQANWHQAFDHCKYNGMELVSIANHVAYNQLTAQVAQELNCSRICAVWIGANDLANEGTFAWAATGLRVSFANWKSNQPDNKHGDLEEDWVEVLHHPSDNFL